MIFKTWLSDINKVALAMDGLKGIQIAGTIDKLSTKSLNAFVKGIDGLTLSQAQAALSTKALTDKQKEQILVSAGLLKTSESITASEIKQTVTENILTTEKQQEILATFELEMSEGKLNLERLEAIALEDTEAGAMARVILAKKKENAQNLKNIASGKSLLTVLKGQLTALATNPLTWAIGAFAGITAVALKSAEAIEKVREKASELGNEFSTSKSDIDGYKTQIEDLYKTINDNNSSVEDITTARQTLMTVQDELIDKFGKEKETIDLVTDAINGQSSALDTLTQKKWQETKNKFNESDFWTGVGNWSQGYESNIDRMVDEMENPVVRIGMSVNDFESGEYTEVIQQMEKLGWTYSNTLSAFTKDGSLEDLYEEILNIQNTIDENAPAHFLKELTTEANKAKATLDSYGSMWDNYILNDKIFADDNLADSWKEVNDAYTKYQNAVASGDKTAIDEATSGFATSINEVLNAENVSDSVKDYFKDMYPALYREVEKWEFKTNIIPEFDTKGLNGKTQADILEMLQTDGAQDGEDVFNSIVDSAIKYGLILDDDTEGIQKILDLLVEWGILQGTISDSAPDFANETTSLLGITETTEKINSEFKPVFDDLKTAYQDIFSLDDNGNRVFDLSNVDIDTLFSIKSAIDSMNEIDGVNIATETYEEFAKVLTDTSSTAEDVQEQFDNLVSELLNQSNIVNLGSNVDILRQSLEQLGVTNIDEVLADIINAERELAESGINLETVTNAQAIAFLKEGVGSDIAKQYLQAYMIQKHLAGEESLNTIEDIESLERLCESLGTTGEMYEKLTYLKYLFSTLETSDKLPTSVVSEINKQVSNTQAEIRALANEEYTVDFDFKTAEYNFDGLKDEVTDFEKSAKDSSNAIKDYIDAYMKYMEASLDANKIDFKTYTREVSAFLKDMFDQGKISAQEYFDYTQQQLEVEKRVMDSVIKAVTRRIDQEIDLLEDEKSLLKENFETKIQNIQSEIDLLEKANEARQKQIDLELAEYELQKALNQRPNRVN